MRRTAFVNIVTMFSLRARGVKRLIPARQLPRSRRQGRASESPHSLIVEPNRLELKSAQSVPKRPLNAPLIHATEAAEP
jgi:hypothetical protein